MSLDDPDEADKVDNRNLQLLHLIAVLGDKDTGRNAILKAPAGKQGFLSKYDLGRLLDGSSERELRVPAYMRGTLSDIGLATAPAPLDIMEVVAGEKPFLMAGDSWRDLDFEVALDSGAVVHVCSLEDCLSTFARWKTRAPRVARQQVMPDIFDGRRRGHEDFGP